MKVFSRPRHSTVVAYLALAVAVSGTAYAAATIRSDDIVNGQVKTADLDDGAVTGPKVDTQAVGSRAIANSSIKPGDVKRPRVLDEDDVELFGDWIVYDGPGEVHPFRFWRDHSGMVHLEGAVEGGTAGSDVMKLPPGYRPANIYVDFPVITTSGEGGDFDATTGYIEVDAEGDVYFAEGLTGYVALDGVSFRAATSST